MLMPPELPTVESSPTSPGIDAVNFEGAGALPQPGVGVLVFL